MSKLLKYVYIFIGFTTLANVIEVAFFNKPISNSSFYLYGLFFGFMYIMFGLKKYILEQSKDRVTSLIEQVKNTKDPNITDQEKEELVQYLEALNKYVK